ncbi:hypothetical protein EUBIFOR_00872 [Holdemanella biformis DSM 3989]|uniref:Uncharacterized protein n=1 Tax=Holdemanella biformis DSM 3989 TaxID=518637 RepID=B7C9L4_9FIRM|nr:hypothetical protein EUBIFOR_00872 [Holdemanella biformis DSM 3989]
MIRPVKNSSFVPSILTVTTAKNAAALTTGRHLKVADFIRCCS